MFHRMAASGFGDAYVFEDEDSQRASGFLMWSSGGYVLA